MSNFPLPKHNFLPLASEENVRKGQNKWVINCVPKLQVLTNLSTVEAQDSQNTQKNRQLHIPTWNKVYYCYLTRSTSKENPGNFLIVYIYLLTYFRATQC